MNTHRHPRTLQEAFGPYTSARIDDGRRPALWPWVLYFAALAALALFVMLAVLA